jgi:predicted O-linked N-acetylglucosamine transferase (SPINDLY family)
VALGADADYRRTVTEALAEHTGRLFEDHEAVADHQRLFSELVEEARGSGSHAAASPCRDDRPADAAERRESHEPAEPRVAEAPLPSDTTAVEPSEAKARPPEPADIETPDTEPADGQSAETAPRGEERLSRQQIRRRLQAAARCHRDGRRNEAEAHCREVLAASPEEVPALMLLGALCLGDGRASEAVELFSRAQAQSPQDAGLLADLGLAHFTAGDTAAAVRLFRKALKRSPDCFQTHLNLGNALRQQEEFDAAERHCRRALELNPRCAEAHNNLGALFQDQGRTRDAEASFRAAIRQRPTYAQAHFNLAVVLQELGRDEEAERHYRRALKIRPDYVQALNNLGNTLQSLGRLEEAEQSFRQALALAPDHLAAINNLAGVLIDRERVDEALEQLQRAFDVNPESAEAHQVRAEAMQRLQRFDEAIASQREALARSPHTPTFLANMAVSLRTVGDLEQAADVCREAQRLEPENPLWQVREATLWPKVFDDVGHIDRHMQKLEHLLEDVGRRKPHLDPDSLNFSGIEPPFGLQFTAGNLRPLKQRYAAMFEHCFPQEPPPGNREKPRIGIFIMEGHEGLLSRSMHGVLRALHGEQFEFVVICSALGIERIKGRMPDLDLTYLPVAGKLSSVARTIRQARLDVLLHREIGTGPITYFLPFFRLAPVQCTTYGIQVTSGISQVDYYLSSAPVEPDDAQDHYAERLLLAETMLPYRRRETRAASGKTRDHFGLAPGDHVYLCAHQLGKFHPDFDPLLNSILTRDPAGRLVITADAFSNAADCLMRRFERTMPACHDRVVMLPRLEVHDYLELIATADVLLDPLHFGGMNTTYDALSFGKPIVTLPSAYHRGRHTLGCYRQIGLLDCVAENAEQYVDTAVALGTDEAYRREVQSELLRASEALFEDNRSIVEHQRLFQGLVDDARSR